MITDPILDAWISSVDTAIANRPELAAWFADRETLVATTDLVEGLEYGFGDALMERDALERHALVLAKGRVEVLRTDDDGEEEAIREANAPTTLGAFGFAIGRRRTVTVRALTPTVALTLTRQSLRRVAERSPEVAVGLLRWMALDLVDWLQQTRGRRDAWSQHHGMAGAGRTFRQLPPGRHPLETGAARAAAIEKIKALTCFQGGNAASLIGGLGTYVNAVAVDAGAGIVSNGDVDRSLLVLLEGKASVRNSDDVVVAEFSADANIAADKLIGELSFLTDTGRDGTVVADTDCVLLEIPSSAAFWIAKNDPDLAFRLHVAVLQTVCWRLHEQDMDRERTAAILGGDFDAWLEA